MAWRSGGKGTEDLRAFAVAGGIRQHSLSRPVRVYPGHALDGRCGRGAAGEAGSSGLGERPHAPPALVTAYREASVALICPKRARMQGERSLATVLDRSLLQVTWKAICSFHSPPVRTSATGLPFSPTRTWIVVLTRRGFTCGLLSCPFLLPRSCTGVPRTTVLAPWWNARCSHPAASAWS